MLKDQVICIQNINECCQLGKSNHSCLKISKFFTKNIYRANIFTEILENLLYAFKF